MKSKKQSPGKGPRRNQKPTPGSRPRGWITAFLIVVACAGAALGAYRLTLNLIRRNSVPAPTVLPPAAGTAPSTTTSALSPNAAPAPVLTAVEPPTAALDTNDAVQVLNYGTKLLAQGKVRDAVMLYERAAVLSPDDEEVFFNLGVGFSRLAKMAEAGKQPDQAKALFAQAQKHYERALELLPDYGEAHNNLGNILMDQRRFDEARMHLSAAIRANPENSSAINNLGKCFALQGQVPEAITQFQKAVELNTNYVEGRFNLGNAWMSLGRYAEAIGEFEQVVQMAPDFELAARRLADAKAKKSATPK